MALTIPNLDRIQKQSPPLGEALAKEQTYINDNTVVTPGNRIPPPKFVTTTRQPG